MVLTIESFVIFTVLAVVRNADELNAKMQPSRLAEALTVALRATIVPAMLSMLFIGCRMYVLATTDGLGEPPGWVKACMLTATVGMSCQFLLVLLLPLFTVEPADVAKPLSESTGDPTDVHPMLLALDYTFPRALHMFRALQFFCIGSIYGGALGVVAGILTFPAQSTQISPAVTGTCALSALYFGVFLLLWVARSSAAEHPRDPHYTRGRPRGAQADPRKADDTAARILRSALAMSIPVRKAPMLAVLFLAARLRSLQLHGGMPPAWAQAALVGATVGLWLEVLAAGLVGATGLEGRCHCSVHFFEASKAAHAAQHGFALVVYACLVPVVVSIFLTRSPGGSPAPLSSTTKCVLWFEVVYFAVHIGQWITFVAQDLFGKVWATVQGTFLAAGVSMNCTPLLAALCVAARMRAWQISGGTGAPPVWAQDGMFLCTFAGSVQVGCCLLMPLFTHRQSEVDADGAPVYDARPMVGGYCVTMVKYVALLSLHIGVALVSISVFVMTPETALAKEEDFDGAKLSQGLGVILLIVMLSLVFSSAKAVGLAIKLGIESADQLIIGTDIEVGKAALSLARGYVEVNGLRVINPESDVMLLAGERLHWRSDCLLKVERLILDINVWKLIKTAGREFEIEAIVLHGVHAYVEKPTVKGTSNLGLILDFLNKQQGAAAAPSAGAKCEEHPTAGSPSAAAPQLEVRTVSIKDVGATALPPRGFGSGVSVQLADIGFDDLTKRLEGSRGAVAGDAVAIILQTILSTVQANTSATLRRSVLGCLGKSTGQLCSPAGREGQQ